jgi:poly-gamma-glutamate capsule biosynthesis protein CapA/YwtB (metallophosphatase superfamily)
MFKDRQLANFRSLFYIGLSAIITCMMLLVITGRCLCQAVDRSDNSLGIVFAGDVMLDGGPGHAVVYGEDPFLEFASIFRNADVAVCNLECAVAPGGEQVLKPYTFRGPPESIPLLKKYFSAICVANNHSCDFGKDVFVDQLGLMKRAELPYFGGGRNVREARQPLVLKRKGLSIALLGFNRFPPKSFAAGADEPGIAWLDEADVVTAIKSARQEYHADIVIPYLHWGKESEPGPTVEQKGLARRLIDAGADAIIGVHPHVIQTVDIYKGRPIVYSLGNMVFDYYPGDPKVWTGWIVVLTFNKQEAVLQVDMETYVLQIDRTGIPHLLNSPKSFTTKEK